MFKLFLNLRDEENERWGKIWKHDDLKPYFFYNTIKMYEKCIMIIFMDQIMFYFSFMPKICINKYLNYFLKVIV